jgi:predicted lipid-binding transport protein (Tim44 family)
MTIRTSGARAGLVILAIGLMVGFASPSKAQSADNAATDNAGVTAPANPADPQAAPASQPAATDQLSDADRAARQDDVKTPVVVTQTETPARASPVVAGSQNASWDETSLIGKIFIGFGALLTVASAARMFMA